MGESLERIQQGGPPALQSPHYTQTDDIVKRLPRTSRASSILRPTFPIWIEPGTEPNRNVADFNELRPPVSSAWRFFLIFYHAPLTSVFPKLESSPPKSFGGLRPGLREVTDSRVKRCQEPKMESLPDTLFAPRTLRVVQASEPRFIFPRPGLVHVRSTTEDRRSRHVESVAVSSAATRDDRARPR